MIQAVIWDVVVELLFLQKTISLMDQGDCSKFLLVTFHCSALLKMCL